MTMPSQRTLFDIPSDVAYFNAAGTGPLPRTVQEAGRDAVARKGQPWQLAYEFADIQYERARRAAAALIGADAADVAIISSVGYGVAIAGKILTHEAGSRVLVLENDHSSPVLEWHTRADAQGFVVETVPQPGNGDWTSAVLDAITRRNAPPVSLASISAIHWSDGAMLDLAPIRDALHRQSGRLLVDATQAVGAVPVDVASLDPDFLIFPTYKWVLGPYGRAFIYIAPRHQDAVPLEQTASGRRNLRAENPVYLADSRYVADARRFDMGERDYFISLEMAAIGMELVAAWGPANVAERLGRITREIATAAQAQGFSVLPEASRAPNILSLAPPAAPASQLAAALAREQIYLVPRVGRLRVSPHVYNDEADVARLIEALARLGAG